MTNNNATTRRGVLNPRRAERKPANPNPRRAGVAGQDLAGSAQKREA